MNCTLSGSLSNQCNLKKLFGGGIKYRISLFKFDTTTYTSINGLSSLEIDDISFTDKYTMDISDLSYNMSVNNNGYSHKLEGKIYNVDNWIQQGLFSTREDRYIVVFSLKNETELKGFGFETGAIVSFSQNIDSKEHFWNITFEELSNYPLFSVSPTADDDTKIYEAIYKLENYYCETSGIERTGYKVYTVAAAYNSSGKPLDIDGHIVAGNKKQAAYLLENTEGEIYDVVGYFSVDDTINGESVRSFDTKTCAVSTTGTLTVSPSTINLDSNSYKTDNITVTTAYSWTVLDKDNIKYCSIDTTNGKGNKVITVSGALGGTDTVRFYCIDTGEISTVVINSYLVDAIDFYSMTSEDLVLSIPVTCSGGTGTFSVEKVLDNTSVNVTVSNNNINIIRNTTLQSDSVLKLKIKHNDFQDEYKIITIEIIGYGDTSPKYEIVAEYCEIDE